MSHLIQAALASMSCAGLLAGCSTDLPAAGTGAEWDTRAPSPAGGDRSSADGDELDGGAKVDTPSSSATSANGPRAEPNANSSADAGAANSGPARDAATADAPSLGGDDLVFLGLEVCSSGTFWRGGNEESPLMRPGYACVDCHRSGGGEEEEEEEEEGGPIYSIAGTVYLTGHEPDDCNGVNGTSDPVEVEVVDATGRITRLAVNRAGNFFTTARFTFPVLTKVRYQGRERIMEGEVGAADGDCNTCHTSTGAEDAPGRIALP